MSAPALSPLPAGYLTVQLWVAGAWLDVSSDVTGDGASITRGRSAEGEDIDPSSARVTLLNPTGRYSPRNPASDLYGLIGRNTPIRIGITPVGGVLRWRFYGEVSAWPQSWGAVGDVSAVAQLECAGVLRRLAQGASPLRSPWYRGVTSLSTVAAYWPLEDAAGSTTCAAALGDSPMRLLGAPKLAAYDALKASDAVPTLGTGGFAGAVRPVPASATGVQVRALVRIPAATPTGAILLRVRMRSAKVARVDLRYSTGGAVEMLVYDDDNTLGLSSGPWAFAVDGKHLLVSLELEQSGANVTVRTSTLEEGATTGLTGVGTVTSATVGVPTAVEVNPTGAACTDLAIGHVSVETSITPLFALAQQLDGWQGEPAGDRIVRLAAEAGLTYTRDSFHAGQPLGVQRTATLVDLIREAARADGGMLFEPRASSTDLAFNSGRVLYGIGTPVITLPVTDNQLDVEPVDDDQATRNRVTVKRDGGSEATAEDVTGPLGTATIGVYDTSVTLSLASDAQCPDQASWRLHLGTVDEARYPSVEYDLVHPMFLSSTTLRDAALDVTLGSLVRITDMPPWLPPDDVDLIVQGYDEEIGTHHHRVTLACTPASPYRVAHFDDTTARYDGAGTVTASTLTAAPGSASLTVTPPAGVVWTHADGDYDVMVSGERMTVTAVAGNVLTVGRGVNGVLKVHAAGEPVRVAGPSFYGL